MLEVLRAELKSLKGPLGEQWENSQGSRPLYILGEYLCVGVMESTGVGRVVRGAFWLGLGSLAVSVLGVVFWFVVAWRFGAVGVGVAGGEVGVAGVVAGLLNFGFGQYVLRGVPLRGRGAFWDGVLASVVVGVAGGFVAFVLGYGWGGALVPLMLCGGPVVGGLVAVGDYVSVFVFQVFGALLKVGLVLAGVGALPAVFLVYVGFYFFGGPACC